MKKLEGSPIIKGIELPFYSQTISKNGCLHLWNTVEYRAIATGNVGKTRYDQPQFCMHCGYENLFSMYRQQRKLWPFCKQVKKKDILDVLEVKCYLLENSNIA